MATTDPRLTMGASPPEMLGGAPDLLPPDAGTGSAVLGELAGLAQQMQAGKMAEGQLHQIAQLGMAAQAILAQMGGPETLDQAGGPVGGTLD